MRQNIEQLLKKAKPKPLSPVEQQVLWSHIETRLSRHEKQTARWHHFLFEPLLFAKRRIKFAATAIALILFLISSGTTVAFADNAKPGDLLFSIDIAAERVRLALASNKKKDELIIRFSKERLDEAKIIVAAVLTETAAGDDFDHLTATATSTPLEDATATTTATTTPHTDGEKPPKIKGNVDRAELALTTALEHLERNKTDLLNRGNALAAAVIDEIIEELRSIVEKHLFTLKTVKITSSDEKLKIKVETSAEKLEVMFQFQGQDEDQDDDDAKTDLKYKNNKNLEMLKMKDGDIKLDLKIKHKNDVEKQKENKNEDEDDEDEAANDNENKGKDRRDDRDERGKITICHINDGDDDDRDEDESENDEHEDEDGRETIIIKRRDLPKHLRHGDTIGRCEEDEDGDHDNGTATTTPDTTAPAISNLTASNITASSTAVSWLTDEEATGNVLMGTSTPVTAPNTLFANEHINLLTSHLLNFPNLTASTTYYYIAISKDAAGNTATSTEQSFTTQ
ncbi:MAG: hypothetical protein A3C80_03685 [Candidatus Ryanbacteria bacterium RIFCSPHIGHO2_02_FULL_45_43]|nr:MAG: hypothetical protein A2718_02945 [Candidatus Ryanbacteria bacterium RIFCSPHIGHO2_01_FULL_44_130]OGZ47778.1 MAG: hypothetical protein A3C80_03685 [Candidatus Ryanbacteria bacterium RIFCSPHIGHO2_02_FULL_45_43]OGZ49671.1 MAG: hypothetical protein A3E55_02140 [Candidatus Ryanbacteria bacterium RIFCSPHIGHO2_12_FULL_44_20]OGZ52164.1 MAG: hypothetical protein A3A17_03005 [Candidatus Ryanbacteria bacterium RIFCSPLOWO2_01_FULL_44_230]OGZ53611.1 MAG: hypothetical protein A3H62_04035 [Candidatus R